MDWGRSLWTAIAAWPIWSYLAFWRYLRGWSFAQYLLASIFIVLLTIILVACVAYQFTLRNSDIFLSDFEGSDLETFLALVRSDGFLQNFIPSIWQDILFFSTIGMVSLIIGLIASFVTGFQTVQQRISGLFGGDHTNPVVYDHVSKKVDQLLVFASLAKVVVTIERYDDAIDALKISVVSTFDLRNLVKDAVYNGHSTIDLYFDDIEKDQCPSGYRGGLSFVSFRDNGHSEVFHKEKEENLYDEESWTFPLAIKANGVKTLRYGYWAWNKRNRPLLINAKRFTENMDITVKNSTNIFDRPQRDVDIVSCHNGASVTVPPGGEETVASGVSVSPGEPLRFLIKW